MKTLLEQIPNEIFLEIFSCLTHVDAVVAFSNLNSRFQDLLARWCHTFDLTSVSKKVFDIILQHSNTYRWHTLKLSDADYTPGQLVYFVENYGFSERLTELRSLSIKNLRCCQNYPLFTQIRSLLNLISLEIDLSNEGPIPNFELPNLKKLRVSACGDTSWLKNCYNLERIEYTVLDRCVSQEPLMWPHTLKYLKIIYRDDRYVPFIQRSLANLCELSDLRVYQIEPNGTFRRGEEWADIINTSLPLLINFKFYFQCLCRDERLNQLGNVVASFSTPFYTSKKRILVRCDVSARHETPIQDREYGTINHGMRHVILYTLPFSFEVFTVFKLFSKRKVSDWSRNTNNNTDMDLCARMKTLLFKSYSPSDPMFYGSSITNLILHTSFDPSAWAHVLGKVQSLTIGDGASLSLEAFSTLLDNAPQLHSLNVKKSTLKSLTNNWTDICVCRSLSKKIRSLNFCSLNDPSPCFERNELEKMLPTFASQCKHLSLCIHSHNNTLEFILQRMSHLSSLQVRMPRRYTQSITMEWLEQQHTRFNHTNCVIATCRHYVDFWLG